MPRFGEDTAIATRSLIYHRVLHRDTAAHELRALLNNEWGTISVVAGLFVLLSGGAAVDAPARLDGELSSTDAVYIISMFASMCAYFGSASSCMVAIFLLHSSNTVPERKLHSFLLRSHSLLWVPLGGLLVALVFNSVANNCATFVIFGSWTLLGIRIGIAIMWLMLIFVAMAALSRAAIECSGPPTVELEEQELQEAARGETA